MSQRLLGRPQRNWEFCLDCETFFPLLTCSSYTRVSSANVWSTALISRGGGSGFTRLLDRVESKAKRLITVSYTHLRAHETPEQLVCRLLLEKKKARNTRAKTMSSL